MYVYVKDISTAVVTAVVDKFISLIWTCRWAEAGEFEIITPYDSDLASQVAIGHILSLRGEESLFAGFPPDEMMVETIEMGTDDTNGRYLRLSGSSLFGFLNYRVNLNEALYYAMHPLEAASTTLDSGDFAWRVYENAFVTRSPMKLIIGETNLKNVLNGSTIADDYIGSSCYDIFVTVMKLSLAGQTSWYDEDDKSVHVYFSKPVDKTVEGKPDNPVILSSATESLESASYVESVANYCNSAISYVIIEETDDDGNVSKRYFQTETAKDGSPSGFFLKETASSVSISSSEQETNESRSAALAANSRKVLNENNERVVQEAEMQQTKQYILGLDYTLGDIVTVADDFSHVMKMLISEISITADSSGIVVTPSFTKYEKD